ncbi:NADH-quinone oxidoreductase subunit N [Flaviaesturariibacter amylovorans]|uniref:NADH-quinone oxidoreductase subunit N n=1 Tax=Flaviaesturariibacter amylovorans TaxID=1084520 RepID=A0ABP8HB46_9BACT
MNSLILSALSGIVMMFSGFFLKRNAAVRGLAVALLIVLIGAAVLDLRGTQLFRVNTFATMMVFDRFASLFIIVALGCTLAYFLLSGRDMERVGNSYSDYFALIFFILAGVAMTAAFQNLLILFLGIEIISIPLYILAGSEKNNLKSNEAGLKYFLMGSFSTGLMLMGIALCYGAAGTFDNDGLAAAAASSPVLMITGMMLLLFALSFKVSAAPFHFWTPDVYDGTPTVFTSFMATVVKAAGFVAFMKLFAEAFGTIAPQWKLLVGIIVAATLFIGNITAVFQQSVKRMLAYSSIAQAGFMMMAVYSINDDAREGLILYAAAYSLATIGIFAVLARMEDQSFEGFNGFARQQPLVAGALVIFVLSLAGIPLTAGFMSKFYMLRATMSGGSLFLALFAVLMAAVSVYYYFRLLQAMYFREGGSGGTLVLNSGFKATLVALAAITILLGLFPSLLTGHLYF